MSKGGKLRVGMDGARELEIEVDDVDGAVASLEKGVGANSLVWVTDSHGARYGIVSGRVAFVEVERATDRSVGFG